jgi:lipid-binding SYLF domain-containing protein
MVKFLLIAVAAGTLTLSGCGASPKTESERTSLAAEVSAAMEGFLSADPTLKALLDASAGYALLPEVGKAGLGIGGSYGNGEVFEKGGKKIGYVELAEGTIGFQIGAQVFSELIVFETAEALTRFKAGEFTFAANATAVAIKPGAAAKNDPSSDVSVFVRTKGGLMAEASIGGQKLNFKPL